MDNCGTKTQYQYDALGRRTKKTGTEQKTEFLWDGDVLLSETQHLKTETQEQATAKIYVFEPNTFKPLAQIQNNEIYHYHLDHLGTPQELTNNCGDIVWSARYKTYGNLALKDVDDVENNLRFQGQYFDQETGLHYNRHRYYNPNTGQFTQQDPIGLLGGLNNYQYAPNPVGWVDPFGLTAKPEDCPKGTATIFKHEPTPDNRFGHYSVEVKHGGKSMHSHQGITAEDNSTTTIIDAADYPPSKPVVHEVTIDLKDAKSAHEYQKAMEWKELGPYDKKNNSCVTHVCNVLREGGADIPKTPLGEFKYLKDLGF